MDINFSNEEILFMYGHFRKESEKLTEIKSASDCPISKTNLNKDIALFDGIANKLRDACPSLSKLDNFGI